MSDVVDIVSKITELPTKKNATHPQTNIRDDSFGIMKQYKKQNVATVGCVHNKSDRHTL